MFFSWTAPQIKLHIQLFRKGNVVLWNNLQSSLREFCVSVPPSATNVAAVAADRYGRRRDNSESFRLLDDVSSFLCSTTRSRIGTTTFSVLYNHLNKYVVLIYIVFIIANNV